MRLGIIGCGSIGNFVAEEVVRGGFAELVAVYDIEFKRAKEVAEKCNTKPCKTFDDFISNEFDIVLESASQQAVKEYAVRILERTNLIVMSAGALVDTNLLLDIIEVAKKNSRKVWIPSGAVAGIDAIKAVSWCAEEVRLVTRKNPSNLGLKCEDERIVFEGDVREAVKKFPKNINVAAVVSLAGAGFDKTKVRIIADPSVNENIHEIELIGPFGKIYVKVINKPFPNNPKTSYLAALSAIKILKNLSENMVVGT